MEQILNKSGGGGKKRGFRGSPGPRFRGNPDPPGGKSGRNLDPPDREIRGPPGKFPRARGKIWGEILGRGEILAGGNFRDPPGKIWAGGQNLGSEGKIWPGGQNLGGPPISGKSGPGTKIWGRGVQNLGGSKFGGDPPIFGKIWPGPPFLGQNRPKSGSKFGEIPGNGQKRRFSTFFWPFLDFSGRGGFRAPTSFFGKTGKTGFSGDPHK
jgi:hypothetical protein